MAAGGREFSSAENAFQYLWDLAEPGPQRLFELPVDTPRYSLVLAQIINLDNSPAFLDIGIHDLSDTARPLEAYHLLPGGLSQLQCPFPSLTGIVHPHRRDGIWIEIFDDPSPEKAIQVADFISAQFK